METGSLSAAQEFTDADYARGMERLIRAVQELSLARSLPEVQRIIRTSARELTGCDGATFVLRDNGKCFYADEDAIAPLWKGSRFPMEICISGWAMLNREAAVIPDIYQDERIPHEAYRPTFVKSLVMVPIRKLDPIGAIGNYWAHERQPSEQEVSLLQALADSTSVAMENVAVYTELEQRVKDRTAALEKANEEIRHQSITDELTGLLNRRGFYLLALSAMQSAHNHDRSCLLAFVDIDGLKRVNDQQGHDAGDELIKDASTVLRSALRKSDVVARMGGDEFCALVTGSDSDPLELRDRINTSFRDFAASADRPYRLSASVGIVQSSPSDCDSLDALLAQADEQMYQDKRSKRENRA